MDNRLFIHVLWRAHDAGLLTRAERDVGRALLRFSSPAGILWASQATIARAASCSVRTVQRAKASLQRLGFLSWRRRRRAGSQVEDTCVYQLTAPNLPPKEEKRIKGFSSSASVSIGSIGPRLRQALTRLGEAMGVPTGEVMPWLPLETAT